MSSPVTITARQREVLTLLARGRTTAEIAEEFAISTRTVRAHMDALRHKFGARRSRELPALYRRVTGIDVLADV